MPPGHLESLSRWQQLSRWLQRAAAYCFAATGDTRLKCDVSTLPTGAIGMVSRSMVSPSPAILKRLFTTWVPLVSNSTSLGPLNHIETFDFRPASLTAHSLPTVLHSNSATVCAPLEMVTWMESAKPSFRSHVGLASPVPSLCCHLPISLTRLESSSAKAVLASSSVLKAKIGTSIGPPPFRWRFGLGPLGGPRRTTDRRFLTRPQ